MRNINGKNKRNIKRDTKGNIKRDELEWMRAMKEHYHLRCLYHVHFMPPLLQKTAKESRSGTMTNNDEQ
jgi:hypothetical protein